MVFSNRVSNPLLYRFMDTCIETYRLITGIRRIVLSTCKSFLTKYVERGCFDDVRDLDLCVVDPGELRAEIINLLASTSSFRDLITRYSPSLDNIKADPEGFGIDDKIYVLVTIHMYPNGYFILGNEEYVIEFYPHVHPVQRELEKEKTMGLED